MQITVSFHYYLDLFTVLTLGVLDKIHGTNNYESFNKAFANQLDLDSQNNAAHRPSDSHSSIPPPPSYENAKQQIKQQNALRQQEQIAQQNQQAKQSSDSTSWNTNTVDSLFQKAMNDALPDFRFVSFLIGFFKYSVSQEKKL
jgi:hypothetical protein